MNLHFPFYLSVKGETGSVSDNGDVTSVSLSLSLSLSLSVCISLSHRKYLTHNIGSASALPIIQRHNGETGSVKWETKSAIFWQGKMWTHSNCAIFWHGKV